MILASVSWVREGGWGCQLKLGFFGMVKPGWHIC